MGNRIRPVPRPTNHPSDSHGSVLLRFLTLAAFQYVRQDCQARRDCLQHNGREGRLRPYDIDSRDPNIPTDEEAAFVAIKPAVDLMPPGVKVFLNSADFHARGLTTGNL